MPAAAVHADQRRAPMRLRRLGLAVLALALSLVLCACASNARAAFKLPRIKHVWVIVLENEGYAATFGEPNADPYLAQTLPSEGALLEDYFATGHASNDNYISLV